MRKWLLERRVAAEFHAFMRGKGGPSAAETTRWLEYRAAREARKAGPGGSPECLTVAGDVAQISVVGVLTEQPDFWAWLFYGANTAYSEIRESLAMVGANAEIKRVEWDFASPGGELFGLFETFAAMEAFEKPRLSRVSYAASAAYGLAAVTGGKIHARTRVSEVGSVGVVQGFYVDEHFVEVTSTDAPKKRPDVTTPEGQAVVREELDPLHDEFAGAIARGRTRAGRETTLEEVNAEFGRGGMIIAEDAKARGMIDVAPAKPRAARRAGNDEPPPAAAAPAPALAPAPEPKTTAEPEPAPTPPPAAEDGGSEKGPTTVMTPEELKAKHPETHKAIYESGRAAGETAERERVQGHLELAEGSGDTKTAIESINKGDAVNALVIAKHAKASMKRNASADRQAESDDAAEATKGAQAPSKGVGTSGDLGDRMVDAMGLPPDTGADAKKPAA